MTAVTVHQHGAHRQQYNPRQSPHSSNGPSPGQSRPQSYTSSASAQMRQEPILPPSMNGTSGVLNPRPLVSNDTVQVVNGNGTFDIDGRSASPTNRPTGESARERRSAPLQARPTPVPTAESSQDESETDRSKHRAKQLLRRSKSDYGPRAEDLDSQAEDEMQDWGARHGFEDHYASEEYVSQLANVSCAFL